MAAGKRKFKIYTVMRNLGVTFLAFCFCVFLFSFGDYLARKDILRTICTWCSTLGALGAFCIATVGSLAAITHGIKYPYTSEVPPRLGKRIIAWFFGIAGLLLPIGVIFAICVIVVSNYNARHPIEVQCSDLSAGEKIPDSFRAKMPGNAKDIFFKGNIVAFSSYASFRCRVSEADFTRFAAENGYALGTNVCVNANDKTGKSDYLNLVVDQADATEIPTNFLSYAYVFSNCGGHFYIFDRDLEKLYYFYSSN